MIIHSKLVCIKSLSIPEQLLFAHQRENVQKRSYHFYCKWEKTREPNSLQKDGQVQQTPELQTASLSTGGFFLTLAKSYKHLFSHLCTMDILLVLYPFIVYIFESWKWLEFLADMYIFSDIKRIFTTTIMVEIIIYLLPFYTSTP